MTRTMEFEEDEIGLLKGEIDYLLRNERAEHNELLIARKNGFVDPVRNKRYLARSSQLLDLYQRIEAKLCR